LFTPARFEIPTAALLKFLVIWDVTECQQVNNYRRFEGSSDSIFIFRQSTESLPLLVDYSTLKIKKLRTSRSSLSVSRQRATCHRPVC